MAFRGQGEHSRYRLGKSRDWSSAVDWDTTVLTIYTTSVYSGINAIFLITYFGFAFLESHQPILLGIIPSSNPLHAYRRPLA